MIKIHTKYSAVPVVHVGGEITSDEASYLKSTLLELADHGYDSIALELADVAAIDNAGIGALLAARGRLAQIGGCLTLVSCSPRLLSDLENTGMTDLFHCCDRLEDVSPRA